MPSTHSSQESTSSCDLAAKNPHHTTTSSFKSIVVEGDDVYTIQPTNLKPAGLENDSWYSSDDDNDDDNQEGQQQEQHQVIEGNQMMNSNDTRNNNTTNVTSANDDTTSVTSAATPATATTTSPASPNTRARVRRVGGLLIVEKDITGISVRNDFERMVASLHVIVGINHSGNLELPAGGLEEGETSLSGAAREMTEEFKHSLLLHLPGPQHARRVNEPSLPVAKSGIPSSVEEIAKNGSAIGVAHPNDIYESIPEQQIASIQFKCNYGEGEAKNRGVTLFLCRYLSSSAAAPFDLDELQQIFQTTHVPVAESVCWCEFEKLTLIPIFAATQRITSASDIELSPEFVHCCFPFENDRNSPGLADKKQDVLDQLLTWFVVADADAAPSSSSSSSDEVERQQQQPTTMTKTQAKKLKNLQRENRRQAMSVAKSFLVDSSLQIANSFLRFSVRPSRRTLQEREMCSLCYTRECQATASDICPLATRQYAYLQLEKALRLKNGAILLKWKIVPPPSASGSTTVIHNSNIFGKLTRFCQGNEWVHQNYRLANDFLSIASTTPGGDDFFEPYVVSKNGDQNTPAATLPPVFAEGVPEVSEVLNEETKAHGYYRRVLVTKVFNLTLHNDDDDDDDDVAVLPPPPPRSQQRSNNDRFRSAAASSTTNRAPPRFEDAVAAPQQQRSFFGANNFNRRN